MQNRNVRLEWEKVAFVLQLVDKKHETLYTVLGIPTEEDELHPRNCYNAHLLNEGWKSWKMTMLGPGVLIDQRTGKTGIDSSRGKAKIAIYHSLNLFFNELKQEVLPLVMKMIHNETGMTTRNDVLGDLVLLSHISKHSCFARLCYLQGWKVEKLS